MAWTATNPVSLGAATKKTQYDTLWDNASYLYDFINARSLFLFEAAAPTGWSIISGCTDGLVGILGGSNAYNVAGGTKLAGTWTQPTHTHTGYSHVHSTADHTLTDGELPEHTHSVTTFLANTAGGTAGSASSKDKGIMSTISAAGGSGAHNHGNTAGGGTAASAAGNTVITWRPYANVGILVAKT
jgi:hypothetical protein